MRDLLRRLAGFEATELPVLSIYLDVRPQATGQNPGVRAGLVILKDRLREIEKTLLPRGDDLESFRTDVQRIEQYLQEEFPASAQGLAIFACRGKDLFEIVEAKVPFEHQVSAGSVPDLFQLARLLDQQETAVVALVDSNTARLFVMRVGALEEVGGPEEDSVHFQKRSTGGWSQARYQRHIEKHRADFAREIAAEIERLVETERAERVILAGDEVAITPLRQALSPRAADLVEEVLRIHIRAPRDEVQREVIPVLAQAEADEARSAADRLIEAVRADGLGVAGLARTRAALEYGQVDELLISSKAEIDEGTRNELIRLAMTTGAEVEMVEHPPALQQFGGIGALLRYRHTAADAVMIE